MCLRSFAALFGHHSFSPQHLKNDPSFSIQLAAVFGARSHEARKIAQSLGIKILQQHHATRFGKLLQGSSRE
jgi:hypothetical protein